MTNIIYAVDEETFVHKYSPKPPEEIRREVETGALELPVPIHSPRCVQLRNYILIAERETPPMVSQTQMHVLELLSLGASLKEIGAALSLSFSGVRYHVETLKEKFNVTTREELIRVYCTLYR